MFMANNKRDSGQAEKRAGQRFPRWRRWRGSASGDILGLPAISGGFLDRRVTDGVCMTSSGCQNPSITYMALTARAAAYAVDQIKKNQL
jgi:hypothetical protein